MPSICGERTSLSIRKKSEELFSVPTLSEDCSVGGGVSDDGTGRALWVSGRPVGAPMSDAASILQLTSSKTIRIDKPSRWYQDIHISPVGTLGSCCGALP